MGSPERMKGVAAMAARIATIKSMHPVRIGVDGFCAAGKTTLADSLAVELQTQGRSVIRACGDDFQNPPEVRHQLGKDSGEGFYRHAMNFRALREELLEPLGPNGSLAYRTSVYDVFASRVNLSDRFKARAEEVLVLDGLFLHASALTRCFEITVFVAADYETCIARARLRKHERYQEPDKIEALYRQRYVPGYELYVAEVQPQLRASFVFRTS